MVQFSNSSEGITLGALASKGYVAVDSMHEAHISALQGSHPDAVHSHIGALSLSSCLNFCQLSICVTSVIQGHDQLDY